MEETIGTSQRSSKGLFGLLDGTPAHVLIILGLALTLVAPVIVSFKGAALAGAQAQHDKQRALKELDLEEFKRQKADEGLGEDERKQALSRKQEELDARYNTISTRREIADAMTAVSGTRSHLVLGWLGRLLLLLGLLILTVQSEGVRQKVLLVVLLVVMFSALSGVNLDFQAQGRMGEPARVTERTPPSAGSK